MEGLNSSEYNYNGIRPTLNEASRNAIKDTRWEAMDNEIDDNLGNFFNEYYKFLY